VSLFSSYTSLQKNFITSLMREYKQLTEEDRIEIYAMMQAGKNKKILPYNRPRKSLGF